MITATSFKAKYVTVSQVFLQLVVGRKILVTFAIFADISGPFLPSSSSKS